jgi:hypothetical protein
MKPKGRKKSTPIEGLTGRLKPRRRGEPDTPPTEPKKYALPLTVLLEIRKAAILYGSQGRALQVGSELLIRMKKPLPVAQSKPPMVRMTYKLVPRTIELIEKLSGTMYEDEQQVLAACMEALKKKKI